MSLSAFGGVAVVVKEKFRDEIRIFFQGGDLLLFEKIWNPTSVRCGISSLILSYKKEPPLLL